jgi:hypothetical protein
VLSKHLSCVTEKNNTHPSPLPKIHIRFVEEHIYDYVRNKLATPSNFVVYFYTLKYRNILIHEMLRLILSSPSENRAPLRTLLQNWFLVAYVDTSCLLDTYIKLNSDTLQVLVSISRDIDIENDDSSCVQSLHGLCEHLKEILSINNDEKRWTTSIARDVEIHFRISYW